MAEALQTEENSTKRPSTLSEKGDNIECAVCLQTCVHPAQLPCGHVFCFLCIKGIANQSKRCAMCRQEIPEDFTDQPKLLHAPTVEHNEGLEDGFQWFYEGHNGWWQYDERTSKELEACYKSGERICELLIAGFLYVVDLDNMLQLRRNDPSRRRRIKRDLASIPKKGIAGLRTDAERFLSSELSDTANNERPVCPVGQTGDNPVTPSITPQSPTSGRESPFTEDLHATVERISSLRLDMLEDDPR